MRNVKPLARSKCRRRRRGTPPHRDADGGSQWRFLRLRACAPPRIVGRVEIWRIDDLLNQNFTAMGVRENTMENVCLFVCLCRHVSDFDWTIYPFQQTLFGDQV